MHTKKKGSKPKKTHMPKKTKGRVIAFLILFFILVVFWISLLIDYWLEGTSFGKFFGRNLHRLSVVVSLLFCSLLYIFSYFIVCQVRKKRRNRKK